jgi:hypothetical protein
MGAGALRLVCGVLHSRQVAGRDTSQAMSRENVEFVQRAFEAYNAGDPDFDSERRLLAKWATLPFARRALRVARRCQRRD